MDVLIISNERPHYIQWTSTFYARYVHEQFGQRPLHIQRTFTDISENAHPVCDERSRLLQPHIGAHAITDKALYGNAQGIVQQHTASLYNIINMSGAMFQAVGTDVSGCGNGCFGDAGTDVSGCGNGCFGDAGTDVSGCGNG